MATVPLRAYINEIESIIEQKQTEEAIAHCRHILHIYPKHIDTYRMLGKAYLESQRYGNAADILQRVLSTIPDDFVSHIGMSIIREDEKNLDAAIWHMERAFEAQPYNAAIQGELRRLYGNRDGMQPPKVHLTRGALARMYVKGDLYQQAIAELRSAIAEDPQRFDLQVFLARMYGQSGQDAMAIETCGTIVNKLPYCLEANRILAQLLESAKRTEEAEAYRKRVQELNPYEAYVGPNAPTEDQVPDQAVRVEQLVWDGGPAVATAGQPEWAASVGVELESSASLDDGLPDWMADSADEAPALPASLDGESGSETEEIPDFMKEAGWGPSTGAFDESKSVFELDDEEEVAESTDAVAGDLPDWLQQMAPPGAIEEPDDIAEAPIDFPETVPEIDSATDKGTLPDWLQETDTDTSEDAGAPDWLAPAAAGAAGLATVAALSGSNDDPAEETELPDWLSEMEGETPSEEMPAAKETETPDWLQDLDSPDETPMAEEAAETEMPDWLQEMAGEEETPAIETALPEAEAAGIPASLQDTLESETLTAKADATEMPDWLQEMDDEEESHLPGSEIDSAEDTGVPDWLAPAAAGAAGLAAAVALSDSDDESPAIDVGDAIEAEMPDWLQEMDAQGEEAPEPTAEVEASEPDIPASLQDAPESESLTVEADATEMPDWLQEMDDEESHLPGSEIDSAEDTGIPDWLAPAAAGAAGLAAAAALSDSDDESPAIDAGDAIEAEMPDWLQEMDAQGEEAPEPTAEVEASESEATDIPASLQDAPESESLTVEADATEMPDWLQEIEGEEAPKPTAETEATTVEDAEMPDWLQEMAGEEEKTPAPTTDTETEAAAIPDWLQETVADEEKGTEPTAEGDSSEVEITEDDGVPDRLSPTTASAAVVLSDSDEEPIETEEAEIPEWLDEIAGEETAPPEQTTEADKGEIPNWLQDAVGEETSADIEPTKAEITELPDWLQETIEDEISAPEVEPEKEVVVDIPDWIQEPGEDKEPETVAEVELEQTEETDIPEWLSEAVENEAPASEVEPALAETEEGDIPDWIQDSAEDIEAIEVEAPELIQEVAAEKTPDPAIDKEMEDESKTADVLKAAGVAGAAIAGVAAITADGDDEEQEKETLEPPAEIDAPPNLDDADAAMAWLESLASKQGVSEDELLTSPEERAKTPPDWVQEIAEDEAPKPIAEVEPEQAEEVKIPEWLSEAAEEDAPIVEVEAEPAVAEVEDTEIPAWIQEATEGEPQPVAEIEPEQAEEVKIPEWLSETAEEDAPIAEVEAEPAVAEAEDGDIPEWLQEAIGENPDPVDDTGAVEAEIPDWIREVAEEEPPEPAIHEEAEEDEDKTTDILKAAGVAGAAVAGIAAIAADGDAEEQAQEDPEPLSIEMPAIEADTPPDLDDADAAMAWLESLAAKQGVSEDELLTSPEERTETPPDWVQEAAEEEPIQEVTPEIVDTEKTIEPVTAVEDEIEWVSIAKSTETEQEPEGGEITTDDLPDWLQEIPEDTEKPSDQLPTTFEETVEDEEEIPEWLNDIGDDIPTIAGETEVPPEPQAEEQPDDIPDWLQDMGEEETSVVKEISFDEPAIEEAPVAKEEPVEAETPDFDDADAAMAWLESLAAKQGVSEEELLTSPEERTETPPDWVQETIETAVEAPTTLVEETPEEPIEEAISEIATIEDTSADTPDWLSESVEEPDATEQAEEPEPVFDLPEFLQDAPSLKFAPDEVKKSEEPVQIPEPAPEIAPQPTEDDDDDFPDFEDADAAMAWLEGLAAKQGVSEEELLTSPEERSETPPDWVQDTLEIEEPAAIEDESTPEAEATPEEAGVPDWILEAPETEEVPAAPETIAETPVVEIPEIPAEPVAEVEAPADDLDFDDADAAMAWLESLAAKQGVSEEELLTSPEERTETPPDWVQKTIEEKEAVPPVVEEVPATEGTLTEEEEISDWMAKVPDSEATPKPEATPEIETPVVEAPAGDFEIEDADAAMAWLESLAAKQGVPEEELLSSPEERAETPPDWVQDAAEAAAPEETAIPKVEVTPQFTEPLEPPVAQVTPEESAPPQIENDSTMAPPSWITDGDIPEEDADFSWIQSAVAEEADQLLDLNEASLIQLERLPGIGFRRAQSITAFRSQHGDFLHLDELLNVPGMDNDTFELLKTRVFITVSEQQPEPDIVPEPALFTPQEAEPDDAIHEQQIAAQSKLNEGNIDEAMSDYETLVKKGQRLDEIIEDLNLAAEKYPEKISIVQTLGDAYMQANRLQEALDAYTKAGELLK